MEGLGQLRTVAPILASRVPERTWGALTIFSRVPKVHQAGKDATCAVGQAGEGGSDYTCQRSHLSMNSERNTS